MARGVKEVTQVFARERDLQREVERAVSAGAPGVEVLALELSGSERFCVYIDHPEGVDHALCARVTDLLKDLRSRYGIDVSSPGLKRPVRTRAHFVAAIGRKVSVRTSDEIAGRSRFRGEVVTAGEEALELGVGEDRVQIPYDTIVRGNLVDEER